MVYTQAWHKNKACNKYIQVSTKGKENSLYMYTKAFTSHTKRCGEPSCLHWAHVLQPHLHPYTQGDQEDGALDPKGLASTYLGIQSLVTRVNDGLNLSCGLAWCKCRFKWKVSVWNVVPTLTSNKRQGLSFNGRCQAIKDSFILVPAEGPYVQQWYARGTILLDTGMPVVGLLQASRERKRGFQVPSEVAEDIVRELESKGVMCRVLSAVVPYRSALSCPLRRGSSSSFL
jgi:hypothetical protein